MVMRGGGRGLDGQLCAGGDDSNSSVHISHWDSSVTEKGAFFFQSKSFVGRRIVDKRTQPSHHDNAIITNLSRYHSSSKY